MKLVAIIIVDIKLANHVYCSLAEIDSYSFFKIVSLANLYEWHCKWFYTQLTS